MKLLRRLQQVSGYGHWTEREFCFKCLFSRCTWIVLFFATENEIPILRRYFRITSTPVCGNSNHNIIIYFFFFITIIIIDSIISHRVFVTRCNSKRRRYYVINMILFILGFFHAYLLIRVMYWANCYHIHV